MNDLADHIVSLLDVEKDKQNIMFHRFPIKSICEIDVMMTLEFSKEEKIIVSSNPLKVSIDEEPVIIAVDQDQVGVWQL